MKSPRFLTLPFLSAAFMTASMPASQAVVFTWLGGTDNSWINAANWDGNGVPETNGSGEVIGGALAVNEIIIENGTFAPTADVPAYAGSGGSSTTPRFNIQAGASLTIDQGGSYGGPVYGGNIVTVGTGANLTWVSSVGYRLMRDPNGTQNYNINGGSFTLDSPLANGRIDFGENENRITNFDLDGGTLSLTGFRIFGTRNDNGTFSTPSMVTLANGSLFETTAFFAGNMRDGDGVGDGTLIFDIQDPGSSATFKLGTYFADIAAVEAAEGINWTSSTLGDSSLAYTQNGDFVTISVIPEPSTFSLVALASGAMIFGSRRRTTRS